MHLSGDLVPAARAPALTTDKSGHVYVHTHTHNYIPCRGFGKTELGSWGPGSESPELPLAVLPGPAEAIRYSGTLP